MPRKSRHGKRKHLFHGKKGGSKTGHQAINTQQPPVSQTYKPAAPPVSAPVSVTTQSAARYPYTLTELKRIGILAGIMLVILVVLAVVLS